MGARISGPTSTPSCCLWLAPQHPDLPLPAASTVGDLLSQAVLMMQRHRRLHAPPSARPLTAMDACNQVWSADFIGHLRTQDGVLYDPFTLCDGYSRYLMRCQALDRPNWIRVRSILDAAFREYGVPEVIRTDNGPPFATASVTGLSRLTVWWITLGMIPSASSPANRLRTDAMSGSIAPSKPRPRCHPPPISPLNSACSTASSSR